MQTFRDGQSAILTDDRWAPVYFVTWFGATSEKTATGYFAWNRQVIETAIRTKTPTVLISDATDAERPPPKVRALMAELSDAQPRAEGLVFSYVVLPNALIRGALTAMQWLTRKPWPIEMVASLPEAIERALAALDGAGARRPAGLDPRGYVRPKRPT